MEFEQKKFRYIDEQGNAGSGMLCFNLCSLDKAYTSEDVKKMLSTKELEYYKNKNEKRKREIFWSRKMAKIGIMSVHTGDIIDFRSIEICKGQFNNPIVKGIHSNYQVSISHCQGFAATLSYPEELVIGLDIEAIDNKEQVGIENILTDREKKLIPSCSDRELFALTMWTTKEALGKFLKLGLDINLEILQISNLTPQKYGYTSELRYFPSLQAYTFIGKSIVYTIVCAKGLKIRLEKHS